MLGRRRAARLECAAAAQCGEALGRSAAAQIRLRAGAPGVIDVLAHRMVAEVGEGLDIVESRAALAGVKGLGVAQRLAMLRNKVISLGVIRAHGPFVQGAARCAAARILGRQIKRNGMRSGAQPLLLFRNIVCACYY